MPSLDEHLLTIMRDGVVIVRNQPILVFGQIDSDTVLEAAMEEFERQSKGRPGCYRLQVCGPLVKFSMSEDSRARPAAAFKLPRVLKGGVG